MRIAAVPRFSSGGSSLRNGDRSVAGKDMRVLLFFVFVSFLVGATKLGRPLRRFPALLSIGAVCVAALYYNYRVVR